MTDWADELADSLYNTYADWPEIATALRAAELRGRVAGMREAADLAFSYMGCIGESAAHAKQRGDMLAHIKVAATKLESSPTT